MTDYVRIAQSITIDASQERVFQFVSDFRNDRQWRPEIRRVELRGPLMIGTQLVQEARLLGFFSLSVLTEVVELEPGRRLVTRTPPEYDAHIFNVRAVEVLSVDVVRFVYELSFDKAAVKKALRFTVPAGVVSTFYGAAVRRYLGTVKHLVEES
ncbi:SRPBCC family protein [Streptomyces sp. NBC_01317]|uniref:SRPBCC family protein n=1 Tax=Streptomyces sp. NBC_01317 TaxID=2903822 RepID=UPI002E11733D|nr:SRPBCC family protein [Streptomyces sp. NBC_01317]